MTLKLDHIVIAVHDLDAAIADYAALGFNVLRGGDHPGRSTHNALVVFEDGSYFELIAWKAPAPEARWWQWLRRHGEGIVDFALLPPDAGEVVRAAAQRGLALDGPVDGGRLRPDGERLRWQVARAPSPALPFLCGDLTPRALRVPEGAARVHPNGVQGVASLAIAVRDLDATLAGYRALPGPASPGQGSCIGGAATLPGVHTRLASITLGDSTLHLFAPKQATQPGDAAEDPVSLRLAARGEGPFAVVLRAADTGAAGPLDLARSHGAAIELEGVALPARIAA